MEERECPKCKEMIEGEDVRGKGHLSYWCDECEIDIDDYQETRENMEHDKQKEEYSDLQELKDEEERYERKMMKE